MHFTLHILLTMSFPLRKKRERIDYNALSENEAKELILRLEKNCTRTSFGCKVFNGSLNSDEYAQIQMRGSGPNGRKRNMLGHIVALRAVGREAPKSSKQHVSHLCNTRNCIEPNHLCVESATENNRRKGCPGDVKCLDCDNVVYSCPHVPKCINVRQLENKTL